MKVTIIIIAIILCLTNCGTFSDRIDEINNGVELSEVEIPTSKDSYKPVRLSNNFYNQPTKVIQKNANSLWRPESHSFLLGNQSKKIGDIIKVIIEISDKAELENETESERENSSELSAPSIFGLERLITGWLPGNADTSSLLSIDSSSTNTGTGTIEREEIIETEIAAMITQILPNGNMVINGDQEIRVNYEVRHISISGIINPNDIAADNSINSKMIAESRISYGGRGNISNKQTPRYGHQIIDSLSPL
ncbi:MAG: flagellar basal body L-ring protein FlgH [Pseudomonadota bacterium]